MLSANRKVLGTGLILMVSLGFWAFHPAQSVATNQSIIEFPTSGQPGFIVTGADGNLWFTEPNAIGRITITGTVTEYPLLAGGSDPWHITAGPDGNIWFTLPKQNKVGRITPSGVITEITGITKPMGITTGPDGNVWITQGIDQIAAITTTGIITSFSIELGSSPDQIIVGSDSNLWYVLTAYYKGSNQIGRITLNGVSTVFSTPTWDSGIFDLTLGRDGNIWFTEGYAGKIGRITPSGIVTEFALPVGRYGYPAAPGTITKDSAGDLWFNSDSGIGRMNLSGNGIIFVPNVISDYITTGPDGNIWYTNHWDQYVGRLHIYQYLFPIIMRH